MADAARPLPLGSTIGILGGGQLGRMLAQAAASLGFRTHIYCPDPGSPAFQVTDRSTCAPYDDLAALAAFVEAVDVVTYEFENVPSATAAVLARRVPVVPDPSVLEITQDRFTEKSFLTRSGLEVAAFAPVSSQGDIEAAAARLGYPCRLKTRRLGYDGKGQALIERPDGIAAAWAAIGGAPAILEAHVPFLREISALMARGADGTVQSFDIVENRHENGILRSSKVPAAARPATAKKAQALARRLAEAMGYVGVLAVEFFLVQRAGQEEGLLANEIAPRVHNSGHWTEDACSISQFEMHVRAVAGWPLPAPLRHSNAEMTNLIGEEIGDFVRLAALPAARLHLYGKRQARPGRKMGHITRLSPLSDP